MADLFYMGNPDDPVDVVDDTPDGDGNVVVRHAGGHERRVPADTIRRADPDAWAPPTPVDDEG